ncbi:methyl-accepting chemotaxis protein [Massilia sp. TS11]|uniref:methyl-accepting chemotaxis protein n=1 Tax=Massilia sp. TS11 TaxID=2908003 RepID=UPI0022AB3952|nr:methyl-accepting chemotaxis protein [Massilia sp. TS11]
MNQLKIATRMLILTGTLCVLLIVIGLLGLFGMHKNNASLQTVYQDRTVAMTQLAEVARIVQRNRILMMDIIIYPENFAKRTKEVDDNLAKLDKNWQAFLGTKLLPEEQELAKAFEASHSVYLRDALTPTRAAVQGGNLEQAKDLYSNKVSLFGFKAQEALDKVMGFQVRAAKAEFEDASAAYARIRMISIGAIIGGLGFAVLFGATLARGIGTALNEAVEVSEAVAAGDLTRHVPVHGNDEVSHLMAALARMQDALRRVVSGVRENAERVAVNTEEIARGNLDLSGRTESQASALQQTAASMEELSSTVNQNADNALQANQLARNASEVAQQGGQIVGEVVETMRGISDSSKKIADIINVIDGIAFQTNILALNAAVEAARAGEQGRGFAVVAGEVRSLASRSAEAAKQIKDLITDSVARVDHGTGLVDRAGHTMQGVVSSIQRVTDIMSEIAAASKEQSAGVHQVGTAVSQMDETTQQNAALVEEMAAAAASLQDQAQALVQAVSVFNLGQQAQQAQRAALRTPARPRLAA